MNRKLRIDAEKAVCTAINAVMPEGAVHRALLGRQFPGSGWPDRYRPNGH